VTVCFPSLSKGDTALYFRNQQFVDALTDDFTIEIIYPISRQRFSVERASLTQRIASFLVNILQYWRQIRSSDVLLVFPSPLLSFWWLLASLAGKPVVMDHFTTGEYGSSHISLPKSLKSMFNWLDRQIYPRLSAITTHSHTMQELLIRTYSLPQEKIQVLLSAVDIELFRPADQSATVATLRKQLAIPTGHLVALYHGLFHPFHGVEVVCEAAQLALDQELAIYFVLLGREDTDIDKPNLKTVMPVPFKQLPTYLQLADVWLGRFSPLVSRERAFSSCMVQALACGKPIITANGPSVQLIKQQNCGNLIAAGNAEALLKALITYQKDAKLIKQQGANARKLAARHFSIHNYQQVLPRLFRQALV
jgi:glycosyltransferase involved in cell wall biosynthesis